jgi:hypothetical protein
MSLTTEVLPDRSLVLIISSPGNPLAQALMTYHTSREVRIVSATHIPPKISPDVKTCFCMTSLPYLAEDAVALADIPETVLIASIETHLKPREQQVIKLINKHYPHIKVALIPKGNHDISMIIERLMYFSFDEKLKFTIITSTPVVQRSEISHSHARTRVIKPKSARDLYVSVVSSPMRFVFLILFLIIFVHTVFFIPLGVAVASTLWQASRLISPPSKSISKEEVRTDPFSYPSAVLALAQNLYSPIRRGWLFVGLATYPERLMDVTSNSIKLYHLAEQIREDSSIMLAKMFDPKVVAQEQILEKKERLMESIQSFQESIRIIRSQTPKEFLQFKDADNYIDQTEKYIGLALKLLRSFDIIFAKDSDRLYAIFFANDRELRPGGGFIGSFALVKIKNAQIQEWKVYDVYDADGQLKARVAPPEPISKYLQQPFYFLRDSAFTPDNPTNVIVAEDFLQKELGITKLDGAVTVTFSSIEKLLGDIGPIYLTEFQDTITHENVYIKTQLYAEQNSFPGSIQKKDFLQALTTEILLQIGEPKTAYGAMESIRESLDEKLIAAYFDDPETQTLFDTMYWSGRQLPPSCISQNVPVTAECVPLYIFPVEANLGVNKANAFVDRDYEYKVRVLMGGVIESEFITYFTNSSHPEVFPGGTYKNYYQLFLPPDVTIQSIQINGNLASDPDIEQDKYTHLGLWIEIPPQGKKKVSIKYRTSQVLPQENSQVQVIFQKQIGMPLANIAFKFSLPEGYSVQDTNFSPLAQDKMFEYNSTIDSDKFYYLHF